MTAFVAAVNFNAMLICLCVLCGLLVCANAVVAALIARSKKRNGKIMQRDVYLCETDDKTCDSAEIAILERKEEEADNAADPAESVDPSNEEISNDIAASKSEDSAAEAEVSDLETGTMPETATDIGTEEETP